MWTRSWPDPQCRPCFRAAGPARTSGGRGRTRRSRRGDEHPSTLSPGGRGEGLAGRPVVRRRRCMRTGRRVAGWPGHGSRDQPSGSRTAIRRGRATAGAGPSRSAPRRDVWAETLAHSRNPVSRVVVRTAQTHTTPGPADVPTCKTTARPHKRTPPRPDRRADMQNDGPTAATHTTPTRSTSRHAKRRPDRSNAHHPRHGPRAGARNCGAGGCCTTFQDVRLVTGHDAGGAGSRECDLPVRPAGSVGRRRCGPQAMRPAGDAARGRCGPQAVWPAGGVGRRRCGAGRARDGWLRRPGNAERPGTLVPGRSAVLRLRCSPRPGGAGAQPAVREAGSKPSSQ
jgi:hypothetical protein